MKYKVGDKVRIKTWEEMKEEYGELYTEEDDIKTYINCTGGFLMCMEKELVQLNSNRVVIIRSLNKDPDFLSYYMTKVNNFLPYSEDIIECLAKDYKKPVPIKTRFEILDL